MFPRSIFIEGGPIPRLHLLDWEGDGPPLLLLHGMAGHAHWWDPVAPQLLAKFHVLAMDLRGHGESSWVDPPCYQMEDYALDLERVRKSMGWDRFHLAAHSLGARVSLLYAYQNPERLRRMALLDFLVSVPRSDHSKFMRRRDRSQPYYLSREEILHRFRLQPEQTLASPEILRGLALHAVRESQEGKWTWRFDWRAVHLDYLPAWELLPRISIPSLVVRGEKSTVMPREDFERVLRELKGSRGIEILGAYHHVTLDNPLELGRELLAFLTC